MKLSFKSRFRSDRDIPLITQDVGSKPMLTVENYIKWYELYVITPDGEVKDVYETSSEEIRNLIIDGWRDHCIDPQIFHKVATKLGATYDIATFESVCRRYQTDYLNAEDFVVE